VNLHEDYRIRFSA